MSYLQHHIKYYNFTQEKQKSNIKQPKKTQN